MKEKFNNNNHQCSLLTVASHDLKQILNAVSFSVEALEAEKLTDRQEKILQTLKNSVNTMERLLNTLIDIQKLESGAIQPQKKYFRLEKLLNNLRAEYQEICQYKQLQFQCNQTECFAYTDPLLLEIIIRNLVANAFRYTLEGKFWIICKEHNNNTLTIEVGDTGLGIPSSQHHKVFAKFYQIDNIDSATSKGYGLGLTIVEKMIKILDLEISLDSKVNHGSRFIVTVPTKNEETDKL